MRVLAITLAVLLGLSLASSRAEQAMPDNLGDQAAAHWKTWSMPSSRELRLPPPPDNQATRSETEDLRRLVSQRAAAHDRIVYWDAGPPSYRWVQLAVESIMAGPLKGLNAARNVALVNVAIYDATVAAWDTKFTYNRHRPSKFAASLTTAVAVPSTPSYPDEHAVTAAAAAGVLSYLFPKDAERFEAMAKEAAQSRVIAGVAYPSDAKAGMDLGAAVATRVLARAHADGFDQRWTGTVPKGPGIWTGNNPLNPLAGTWHTWVLEPASRFRPGPPPAYNSPQKLTELTELKTFPRTLDSNATAFYAQTGEGVFGQWYGDAGSWMLEDRLDDAPRAARIYAAMSMAQHDAMVACWDAKFTYWAIRPFQLDPDVKTLFPTPNHPSYPAAHGCGSASIAAVMAHYFPTRASFITARADTMAWSRLAAGIHFRSDIVAGLQLGRSVAGVVTEAVDQGTFP